MLVAPGSCKSPSPGCKPRQWEDGGNSLSSCISANCCCCLYCWRLPGRYSNDCRERTAAAAAGSLDQEIRAGTGDWRRGRRASQPEAAPGPRELPADARSSRLREQSGWQRRRPRPRPLTLTPARKLTHTPGAGTCRLGAYKRSAWSGRRAEAAAPAPLTTPPPAPSSLLTPRSSRRQRGLSAAGSAPFALLRSRLPTPSPFLPSSSLRSSAAPALFSARGLGSTAAAARGGG